MEKVPLKPSSSDLALLSLPPDIQKQARAVARIDPYWTAAVIAVRHRHGRRRCKVPLTCRRPRVPFVQITLAPTAQNLTGLEQNVTLQRLLMTYTLQTSFVNNFNYTFSGAVVSAAPAACCELIHSCGLPMLCRVHVPWLEVFAGVQQELPRSALPGSAKSASHPVEPTEGLAGCPLTSAEDHAGTASFLRSRRIPTGRLGGLGRAVYHIEYPGEDHVSTPRVPKRCFCFVVQGRGRST